MIPDVEQLLVHRLLADPDLSALVGTRITTELPKSPAYPCLTLHLVTETDTDPPWLDNCLIQYDAWADAKSSASIVARTTAMALKRIEGQHTQYGTVTYVSIFGRHWFPDTLVTPARPRYVGQARVAVHP